MFRRSFLLSVPAMMVAMTSAFAEEDVLAAAFNRLPSSARVASQEKLAASGFYNGGFDGVYGPGTRSAIINAAALVKDNSYGKLVFDLSSRHDAGRFLAALAGGEFDKYLWGEGDEAEGG